MAPSSAAQWFGAVATFLAVIVVSLQGFDPGMAAQAQANRNLRKLASMYRQNATLCERLKNWQSSLDWRLLLGARQSRKQRTNSG